jgi:hypothetical protein
MSEKTAPVGTCDHCGGSIHPDEWYTRRGPRRYCCRDCKNTANSRAGAPIRSDKGKQRVALGTWTNPRDVMTQEQISAVQSQASRKARLREVREGRWRNPALDDAAREKLSRPRKHVGIIHRVLEKLRLGSVRDLTDEEREAHNAYRRDLAQKKRGTQ